MAVELIDCLYFLLGLGYQAGEAEKLVLTRAICIDLQRNRRPRPMLKHKIGRLITVGGNRTIVYDEKRRR